MQTEFSLEFLLENTGCRKSEQIENLFPKDREVVSYKDILQSNIPLEEKYWFFCHRVFTDSQNRHLAIKIAEVVLPIFEDKYPEDNRPRKAIEAARLYLAGEIGIEELEAAAGAAARAAAYAARAAAYAGDAARAAAYAAAYAGDAARAAAYAAGAADAYKTKLTNILTNFIENNLKQQ